MPQSSVVWHNTDWGHSRLGKPLPRLFCDQCPFHIVAVPSPRVSEPSAKGKGKRERFSWASLRVTPITQVHCQSLVSNAETQAHSAAEDAGKWSPAVCTEERKLARSWSTACLHTQCILFPCGCVFPSECLPLKGRAASPLEFHGLGTNVLSAFLLAN